MSNVVCPVCGTTINTLRLHCPHCARRLWKDEVSLQAYKDNLPSKHWQDIGQRKASKVSRSYLRGLGALAIVGLTVWGFSYLAPIWNSTNSSASPLTADFADPKRCSRQTGYPIKPEFERSINLINQRFSQYVDSFEGDLGDENSPGRHAQTYINRLSDVRRCLNIEYSSEVDDIGANGTFLFNQQSQPNNLIILISPRYAATDDLLTALLLAHEITHAQDYHRIYPDVSHNKDQCLQAESVAYYYEIMLLGVLSKEEQSRMELMARTNVQASAEFDFLRSVLKSADRYSDLLTGTHETIKKDPVYIAQCETIAKMNGL